MRGLFRLVTSVFLIGLASYASYLVVRRRRAKEYRSMSQDRHRRRKVVESSVVAGDGQ